MAMVAEGPSLSAHRGHTNRRNMTMATGAGDMEGITKYSAHGPGDGEGDHTKREGSSRPMSALARGVQITEFAESRVNPTPLLMEESDILLEQYLSPGKLQLLTGVDNLSTVECLELKVDSRETSLGNFGSLLPNLQELKLSGSCISCVRDLGSSLRNLRVLWLTRCGLEELDGVSSMLQLAELYLQYNEISDLSPLAMLEQLEILDLEGNNIDDVTQVQYLSLCPRLRRLALDGNPICVYASPDQVDPDPDYDYRGTVTSFLPNLLVLDDERVDAGPGGATSSSTASASLFEEDGESAHSRHHNVFDEDWAYLEELQQDAFLQQEFSEQATQGAPDGDRPPTAALRPATGYRPGSALRPSSGFRPLSASRRRPSTMSPGTPSGQPGHQVVSTRDVASSEGIEVSSELTMGSVICGNPSKALRQRRHGGPGSKEEIRKGLSKLLQKGAVFSHSEGAEDETIKAEDEMNNIIEELQSWKVDHDKRMKEILKSKEAQILVVDHDEAEDVLTSEDEDDEQPVRRPPSSRPSSSSLSSQQQRHTVDLRLKKKQTGGALAQSEEGQGPWSVSEKRSPGSVGVVQSSSPDDLTTAYQHRHHQRKVRDNPSLDDSWDDNDSDEGDQTLRNKFDFAQASGSKRGNSPLPSRNISSSSSSRPGSTTSPRGGLLSQNGSSRVSVSPEDTLMSAAEQFGRRPGSRGRNSEELGPLRAPSPTSAQIINSMRSRQSQSPPSSLKPRKLRVGPTGLPGSSQSQQPVIRGSIVPPPPSRGGSSVLAGLTTLSSRPSSGGVPLLPSQPRLARKLPETPTLPPRPPRQT